MQGFHGNDDLQEGSHLFIPNNTKTISNVIIIF